MRIKHKTAPWEKRTHLLQSHTLKYDDIESALVELDDRAFSLLAHKRKIHRWNKF